MIQWRMVMTKGDDIILTENQYEAFKQNKDQGTVYFKNFSINPAYLVSTIKEPAHELKNMYPCLKCQKTGKSLGETCPKCDGSGVDLTNV